MAVRVDPEQNETRNLFALAELGGQRVLEIGCGDGRLTRLYADKPAHVTAVDPWVEWIAQARKDLPGELQERVEFVPLAFEDFAARTEGAAFAVAILAWSL